MNLQRMPRLPISVRPFFDPKAALDVHWPTFREILRSCFSLPPPKRHFEPGRLVLHLAGFVLTPFVGSHREGANGRSLRRIPQFGIPPKVSNENDLIK